MRYAALLRGINVGGRNKLPMRDLAAILERAGCRDVETYIQSGNAVFSANRPIAKELPRKAQAAIASAFGYDIPVVVRSASELHKIAGNNPYDGAEADITRLGVAFLAKSPTRKSLNALAPDRSPPDRFSVVGQNIYLNCPNGFARTKLTTGYFDSKLETISTIRNWKTVLKLAELLA